MLKVSTLISFITLLFISPKVQGQEYRIFIHPSSKVTVFGSTNVNSFRFEYMEEISIDRPVRVTRSEGSLKLSGGMINLKVKAFDSGNGIMNKDFRKMLLEEENPFIQVELQTLTPTWQPNDSWREGKAEIEVTINAIAKTYSVSCRVENPGSLLIYGKQKILLTDFGLTPPVRMMGMVKVSEWVDLDFALRFATDR
ncbi:MAG TPA: YceI family protein [Cyclobacteriaceae bacterium]|nr:YceI family protein [Cyclobacteriaceae bacterium]HRJ83601.1 YceI family protein [Cyclobacteriaceae bacterium]